MSVRALGRVLLPVAFAGSAVVLTAGSAFAAVNINVTAGGSSVSNSTVTSYTTLTISGSDTAPSKLPGQGSRQLVLSVTPPGGSSSTIAVSGKFDSDQDGHVSGTYDLACAGGNNPCRPGPNGDYQFDVSDGSGSTHTDVYVQVAPTAPTGFHAGASGSVVSFSWNNNPEPDIAGYDIVDSNGTDTTVDPSACDSNGCAASRSFGSAAYGTSHTFRVVALRCTSPSCGKTLTSAPSASQTVNFPAAPAPSSSPSSDPNSGGGGGAGTGGTGSSGNGGSSSTGSGSAGGSGSHAGSSTNLAQALPVFHAGGVPNLPDVVTSVKPLPEGTFKPTLAYPDQTRRVAVKQPQIAARVGHVIASALDHSGLWRGVAAAAILLLMAAHLRTWVARSDVD